MNFCSRHRDTFSTKGGEREKNHRARPSLWCCGSWWGRTGGGHPPCRRTRGRGTGRHWSGWSGSCYHRWQPSRLMRSCRWCCSHWAAAAEPRLSETPCWTWNGYWCRSVWSHSSSPRRCPWSPRSCLVLTAPFAWLVSSPPSLWPLEGYLANPLRPVATVVIKPQ